MVSRCAVYRRPLLPSAGWGAAEAFHEGRYFRDLGRNLFLTYVQYFSPVLVVLIPAGVALRWRCAAGVGAGRAGAAGALCVVDHSERAVRAPQPGRASTISEAIFQA